MMAMKSIQKWCKEYNVPFKFDDGFLIKVQIIELDKHKLGNCKYYKERVRNACVISISDKFREHYFLFDCILWHEFCHAEYYLKTGDSDHHSEGFHRRQWRKPILAIGDYIAKFINPFL